jgi:two-component sensor histidine kinase
VKNETRSGHSVPNVSLRIGRTSLRANRGSTALGSPESKLTRDIAGPARGIQTDRMLGPSRHVLDLILQIKDNGSGIPTTRLVNSEGIGLRSMREHAAQIGAKLVTRTGPGRRTRIIVTVPITL